MARHKRSEEEHENLERWLVSYADFITLLFAFFVVMYAISSVNEGKYRILSESISAAFLEPRNKFERRKTVEPIQIGETERNRTPIDQPVDEDNYRPAADAADEAEDLKMDEARLQVLGRRIAEALASPIENELVKVRYLGLWLEVEMKSGLLFASGKAEVANEGLAMLHKLAEIFREAPNAIQVEGYTDNIPINTREFPSNWELSSARAASVVHQLMRSGIEPARMAAIGYSEYHPIADNDTEEGRYQNRRVVILLLSKVAARHNRMADQRVKSSGPAQNDAKSTQTGVANPEPAP